MSKRLIDTEIWKKPWFFDLPDKYKLFWFYILSDCDQAGIWTANFKVLKAYIGDVDTQKLVELFNGQLRVLNGGTYWLINDFIKFQYGFPVNEKHKMYGKLNELLNQRGLDIDTLYNTVYDTVCHTVSDTVCHTVKDKDIVKDKDNRKGVQGENKKSQPPIQEADLTDELKEQHPHVYRLGKMLLDNCPDVMAMEHPLSLIQLKDLIKKYGAEDVEKVIKAMQNKGIKYLKQKSFRYTFLTIENWIKR